MEHGTKQALNLKKGYMYKKIFGYIFAGACKLTGPWH